MKDTGEGGTGVSMWDHVGGGDIEMDRDKWKETAG